MNTDSIGEKIRKRRIELGIKQDDLAAMVGTSQGHLSDIENGKSMNPGIDTIRRITEALKLKNLLDENFEVDITNNLQLQELIHLFNSLSPRGKEYILKQTRNLSDYEQQAASVELRA